MCWVFDEGSGIDDGAVVAVVGKDEGEFYWAIDLYAKRKETREWGTIQPRRSFEELYHLAETHNGVKELARKRTVAYDYREINQVSDFFVVDGHYFESPIECRRMPHERFRIE